MQNILSGNSFFHCEQFCFLALISKTWSTVVQISSQWGRREPDVLSYSKTHLQSNQLRIIKIIGTEESQMARQKYQSHHLLQFWTSQQNTDVNLLNQGGSGQKDYQVHDDVRRMLKEMGLFSLQRTLQRGDTEEGS